MAAPSRARRVPWPYKQTAYTVAILVAIYGVTFVGGTAFHLFHGYQERKDLERKRLPSEIDCWVLSTSSAKPTRRFPKTAEEAGLTHDPEVFVAYAAEAAVESDNSPTLAQPILKTARAQAFAPVSLELAADWDGILDQLVRLILSARDDLEATKFTLGSGTNEPEGLLTGATTTVATAGAGALWMIFTSSKRCCPSVLRRCAMDREQDYLESGCEVCQHRSRYLGTGYADWQDFQHGLCDLELPGQRKHRDGVYHDHRFQDHCRAGPELLRDR